MADVMAGTPGISPEQERQQYREDIKRATPEQLADGLEMLQAFRDVAASRGLDASELEFRIGAVRNEMTSRGI